MAPQRTCSSCNAQLTTRAARVQELRARSLFQQMASRSGMLLILASWSFFTLRDPQAAMARLSTVHAGWSESQLREYVTSSAEGALPAGFVFTAVLFALAMLSRRLPLASTALSFALWLGWCTSWAFAIGTFNFFALGFLVVFTWGAYRCLRLGVEMRAADRELRQHEALRGSV